VSEATLGLLWQVAAGPSVRPSAAEEPALRRRLKNGDPMVVNQSRREVGTACTAWLIVDYPYFIKYVPVQVV
jgi:hypothetical protein